MDISGWLGIGGLGIGGVIWAVRQEGRINLIEKLQEEKAEEIISRLERIERKQDAQNDRTNDRASDRYPDKWR